MTLVLPGRIPSKKNSKRIIQAGGRPRVISSEAFLAWHEEHMLRLRTKRPKKPLTHAEIGIKFFPPDKIKGDLTNKAESICDLLVDAGFLADDNWAVLSHVCLSFGAVDPKNPRAEVQLQELVG